MIFANLNYQSHSYFILLLQDRSFSTFAMTEPSFESSFEKWNPSQYNQESLFVVYRHQVVASFPGSHAPERKH